MEKISHYVFSYFIGNGEDGLHLAYSTDGYTWRALNKAQSILTPEIGTYKLMRDPCIISGKDNIFHMVWTIGWEGKGIGLVHSKDLITWSDQEYLPVMEHEPTTRNCWAPELFYDEKTDYYFIFWASTIPGRFAETEGSGDTMRKKGLNHRMYYTKTQDFKTFSETKLFYDGGFNVIDATITTYKSKIVMIVKDETRTPVEKNLKLVFSDAVEGPFSPASEPFTPSWVEGPSILKIGEKYILYFDEYSRHSYSCMSSTNFQNWVNEKKRLTMPKGVRHGFPVEISENLAEKILKKYPVSQKRRFFSFKKIEIE